MGVHPPTPSQGGGFFLRARTYGAYPQTPRIRRMSDAVANPFQIKAPLLGGGRGWDIA